VLIFFLTKKKPTETTELDSIGNPPAIMPSERQALKLVKKEGGLVGYLHKLMSFFFTLKPQQPFIPIVSAALNQMITRHKEVSKPDDFIADLGVMLDYLAEVEKDTRFGTFWRQGKASLDNSNFLQVASALNDALSNSDKYPHLSDKLMSILSSNARRFMTVCNAIGLGAKVELVLSNFHQTYSNSKFNLDWLVKSDELLDELEKLLGDCELSQEGLIRQIDRSGHSIQLVLVIAAALSTDDVRSELFTELAIAKECVFPFPPETRNSDKHVDKVQQKFTGINFGECIKAFIDMMRENWDMPTIHGILMRAYKPDILKEKIIEQSGIKKPFDKFLRSQHVGELLASIEKDQIAQWFVQKPVDVTTGSISVSSSATAIEDEQVDYNSEPEIQEQQQQTPVRQQQPELEHDGSNKKRHLEQGEIIDDDERPLADNKRDTSSSKRGSASKRTRHDRETSPPPQLQETSPAGKLKNPNPFRAQPKKN